ncbi:hypothetical protein A3J90_02120 [candidate division WOR-1 bacterium RIFOXYC2_FULL_37_10]|uniref:DUF2281 domain-containing protein n=1 Tax=candidate division WOR-1 bacterium RIFOXYB2_FULL_37_13 TaxID=1802579 RepID=A0A1F4SU34_UNCSA|nr:MAG: hypothetical protein A2310_05450 [candidate division WOR-1 bacterium RIFOXYB2_FULL_37_13]OGC33946.1 MAG: hypothetical protein A3J90_02120 [candidate division WOR-1 bacterium RIFOXYC2_FULL_37_10]
MKTDIKKERLIELYDNLPPVKKEEVFDFVEWLWISKESKFIEQKKPSEWLKKLSFLFFDVRKQTKKSSSKKIDLDITEAIKETRKKHA